MCRWPALQRTSRDSGEPRPRHAPRTAPPLGRPRPSPRPSGLPAPQAAPHSPPQDSRWRCRGQGAWPWPRSAAGGAGSGDSGNRAGGGEGGSWVPPAILPPRGGGGNCSYWTGTPAPSGRGAGGAAGSGGTGNNWRGPAPTLMFCRSPGRLGRARLSRVTLRSYPGSSVPPTCRASPLRSRLLPAPGGRGAGGPKTRGCGVRRGRCWTSPGRTRRVRVRASIRSPNTPAHPPSHPSHLPATSQPPGAPGPEAFPQPQAQVGSPHICCRLP